MDGRRRGELRYPRFPRVINPRCSVFSVSLDHQPRGNHSELRHDDDAAADVVAVAVGMLDVLLVDQARAVADAGVLVDDRVLDHDALPDAERRQACRRRAVFVEVGSEQHRAANRRSLANGLPYADDRFLNLAPREVAALGLDRIAHPRTRYELAGQLSTVCVDFALRIPDVKGRTEPAAHHGVRVERLDRSDVGPVAAKQIRAHAIFAERVWNELATEVVPWLAIQDVEQYLTREHVHAHRGHEGPIVGVVGEG